MYAELSKKTLNIGQNDTGKAKRDSFHTLV